MVRGVKYSMRLSLLYSSILPWVVLLFFCRSLAVLSFQKYHHQGLRTLPFSWGRIFRTVWFLGCVPAGALFGSDFH